MALNCNFMRLLTRDEPAVFFCTYLRSTDFLLRLCALTKQAAHRKATLARPGDRTSIV